VAVTAPHHSVSLIKFQALHPTPTLSFVPLPSFPTLLPLHIAGSCLCNDIHPAPSSQMIAMPCYLYYILRLHTSLTAQSNHSPVHHHAHPLLGEHPQSSSHASANPRE
jgi:hypothetical protein